MSAHRKSKNASAAPASSPAERSVLRRSTCACSAASRDSSSRCSTQKGLVKYEPVALRCPETLSMYTSSACTRTLVSGPGGDVLLAAAGGFDGEVVGGDSETGLQQPLVDGAELTHRQRPEIHGADALGAVVKQQPRQRRAELVVGEAQIR